MAADGQYSRVNGSEKEADDEAPLIAQPVRPVGFRQEAKEDFKNVRPSSLGDIPLRTVLAEPGAAAERRLPVLRRLQAGAAAAAGRAESLRGG